MSYEREVPLSIDMGSIGGRLVRAVRAVVGPDGITLGCMHETMPTEWHEGHLVLPNWTAVDDHGAVLRASSMSRTQSGGQATVAVTFAGLSPGAGWVDIHINGYDGQPVLTVRVELDDGGGASIPAIPPSSPPPMERPAEAEPD